MKVMPHTKLDISEIEIIPVKPRSGLVAFASFVLDHRFYVGDVAIHTRPSGGYRLLYPEKTLATGKRINVVYPIGREAGDAVERAVIEKFEELLMKVGSSSKTRGESEHEQLKSRRAACERTWPSQNCCPAGELG